MGHCVRRALFALLWLVVVPALAYGQASIVGEAKDASGAVLPGVTVEATSPALIEKVRTALTDGAGRYAIENLRPGAYSVTFTLPGFATVRREGIELAGSFAATINADLRLGGVAETVTVTGQAPVVDVRNTTRQNVVNHDIIDALPTGRSDRNLAILIPGVSITGASTTQDVGGTANTANASLSVHGSRGGDQRIMQNGVTLGIAVGTGNNSTVAPNMAANQEIVVDTGAASAEIATGGVRINYLPRDGGNTFQGTFYAGFANESMQGSNFTEELRAAGLRTPDALKRVWDLNPGFGGPIKRDRLWFYVSAKWYGSEVYPAGIAANLNANNPALWTYVPDPASRPFNRIPAKALQARLTWQATPKNKIAGQVEEGRNCFCSADIGATVAPEAALHRDFSLIRTLAADWTAPVTNRLLFEAVGVSVRESLNRKVPPGTDPRMIAVTDTGLGNLTYRAPIASGANPPLRDTTYFTLYTRFAASYVTGAHSAKVGMTLGRARETNNLLYGTQPVNYRFNNGVPNQITVFAMPVKGTFRILPDLGLYAQDKWTMKRMTLGVGIRYDYIRTSFPAQEAGPAPLVPARNLSFPAATGISWHDITPKLNVSYDLFGTGRTALKLTMNKYLQGMGSGEPFFGTVLNPVNRLINQTTRSWTDANGNFIPECDLVAPLANGECGGLANLNFGRPVADSRYDPEVLTGWGKRGYDWEFSTGVQHELLPRVSVDLSYFRRAFGNFYLRDNAAVSAADYTSFSLIAPSTDPRLPTAGQPIAGVLDLVPARFGQTDTLITAAKNYGDQSETWNGVDFLVNARPGSGLLVSGGLSTGRAATDICDVAAQVPEVLFGLAAFGNANTGVWTPMQFCKQEQAWLTQFKALASYTIPRVDLQVSATLQNIPGPPILANWTAPGAAAAGSLGRPLSGNATTISVQLVSPGEMYGERLNQLDFRVAKILRFGRTKTQLNVDLFNALNGNAILGVNNGFGGTTPWQRPNSVLNARFIRLSTQVDF